MRYELRQILTPCIVLREPFLSNETQEEEFNKPRQIKDIASYSIVLNGSHIHSRLQDLQDADQWQRVLPDLLCDFTTLLNDVMDLKRELGEADDYYDLSYIPQPSIAEHTQNNKYTDWTALIDLTRDAWLATVDSDKDKAIIHVLLWWKVPYPVFKRLCFFAATRDDIIDHDTTINWMLSEDGWWLWSSDTRREIMRLLVETVPRMKGEYIVKIEEAIIKGPPLNMFRDDTDPDQLQSRIDRNIWLRLSKMQSAEIILSENTTIRINEITDKYKDMELSNDGVMNFHPGWSVQFATTITIKNGKIHVV